MDRMAQTMGDMQAYQEMMMSRGARAAPDQMSQSAANTQQMQAYQEMMMRRAMANPQAGGNSQQQAYQEMMARNQRGAPDMMSQSLPSGKRVTQDVISQSMPPNMGMQGPGMPMGMQDPHM